MCIFVKVDKLYISQLRTLNGINMHKFTTYSNNVPNGSSIAHAVYALFKTINAKIMLNHFCRYGQYGIIRNSTAMKIAILLLFVYICLAESRTYFGGAKTSAGHIQTNVEPFSETGKYMFIFQKMQ